jgi:hypothetical protein
MGHEWKGRPAEAPDPVILSSSNTGILHQRPPDFQDLIDPLAVSESWPVELQPFALIRPDASGRWEPAEEGDAEAIDAILLTVYDLYSEELVDVVAWDRDAPWMWWLRGDRATFLGEADLFFANQEGRKVEIVATPAQYLDRSGRALCILDWSADVAAIVGQAKHGCFCTATVAERLRRTIDARRFQHVQIEVVA